MEAPAATASGGRTTRARQGRLTTIVIMAVTAAVIGVVAFVVNQPAATTAGVTEVSLTGDAGSAAPEVGKAAPDFLAQTVDGKTVKLSDFKGKPVWLTFGASWCQPCRAENPDIQAAVAKHAGSDLVVLGVFISEDTAAVKDYGDRVGLTYQRIADPSTKIASQYRILGIPSHFFIDKDGILRQVKVGSLDPASMDAAIQGISG
jgi:cytochrome c biogenesis protein CcmG, thiol:disulfide interchange protein DsbE